MRSHKPKPELHLEPRADGRTTVHIGRQFTILGVDIPDDYAAIEKPGVLHSTVTAPRRKLATAKWFLTQLRRCLQNEAAALMFLEGFVSEVRSATFTLQFLMSDFRGFSEWYQLQQDLMRKDRKLRWLVEARNAAQKRGLALAEWGPRTIVRHYRDGRIVAAYEHPHLTIEGAEESYTLDELQAILDSVGKVVELAHESFYPVPNKRNVTFMVEFVRERTDGNWEHFNPPG